MSFDYDPAFARRDHSSARLDATLLRFEVPLGVVRDLLARRDLTLAAHARRRKRHYLTLELWQVSEGQLSIGPVSFRDACAVAGAAVSSLPAALGHGALRVLFGTNPAAQRALARSEPHVHAAGAFGAAWGRTTAHAFIRALGQYNEVVATIPDVQNPVTAAPCQWVLGMYTNSALARAGAALLGFGFDKRPAQIERDDFERYEVHSDRGSGSLIDAQFSSIRTFGALPADWREQLDQPFLGFAGRTPRAVSCTLTRHWSGPEVATRTATGTVHLSADTLFGPLRGEHRVGGSGSCVKGLHVGGLQVRLSYPWA